MKTILAAILAIFSIAAQANDNLCFYTVKNERGDIVAAFDLKEVAEISRPPEHSTKGTIFVRITAPISTVVFSLDDTVNAPLASLFVLRHSMCMKSVKPAKPAK